MTRLLTVALLLFVAACGGDESGAPATPAGTLFARLPPERTGIDFANRFDWEHERAHLYPHGFAGGGVCVGDYDGDGRPDVYLVSQVGSDRLYRQTGDLVFADATAAAGIGPANEWGAGAVFADVDDDGLLDLYVCNLGAPNRLHRNRGDGTFEECAARFGLDFSGASVMAGFADYDRDGDLDLYLLTNRLYPGPEEDNPRTEYARGRVRLAPGQEEAFFLQERVIDGETQKFIVKAGQRDHLYRNDGGAFTDVSAEAGITGAHPGLSATWWDYDADGWPDLYVGNDFWDPDRLYRNEGDGTFRDVAREALPSTPWFSMGADFADLDGDGRLDLLAADMSPTTHYMAKIMMGDMRDSRWFLETAEPRQAMRNALFLNTGTPRFMEVARLAHLDSTDWTWSVKLDDLDNDGRVDAFFTNGTANHSFDPDFTRELEELARSQDRAGVRDPRARREAQWRMYVAKGPREERNVAFRNARELFFEDATEAWGLGHVGLSFGAATADLDRDGDLDLVVNNTGDVAGVYENRSAGRHFLLVRLQGTASNSFGIGATLELASASGRQVRHIAPTRGYMSANEPLAHFGLGADERVLSLTVAWPSGRRQRLADVAPDRLVTVIEPAEGESAAPEPGPGPALFRETAAQRGLAGALMEERAFDDFALQPLLPARLSRLGPGLAVGDADGDGRDDLFVGGPAGRAGELFLQGETGAFRAAAGGPWTADAGCEDMAPLFLDADGDGDFDLYVASGGVEAPPGDPLYRDRLYVNDGEAGFRAAPGALPAVAASAGAVAAADVDKDGDLDLFVGGRTVPGRYPESPASRLLLNEGGVFRDAAHERAPGLERVGMVTGALFSDADGDGWPDLLVTLEWGPVAFFRNDAGRFVDETESAGLAGRTGWWNAVDGADLDGDGDVDYVVGNAGLNTKYTATPEEPALLYYGKFAEGPPRVLEAKSEHDALLPVRGLSCSADAMPFVGEKLSTYHAFASARLDEIYDSGDLARALCLRATHLESGVLENVTTERDGVRFAYRALPRRAQAAPVFGIVVSDFDADGDLDALLVGNSYAREPETGRWNGGLGLVLANDGAGALTALAPAASGWSVPGDAKGLAVCEARADGRPVFAVTRNGAAPLLFEPAGGGSGALLVRLAGPAGNPTAVGARVTVLGSGGAGATAEVRAGSGYLSQSSGGLFFGRRGAVRVRVRWPDGRTSEHAVGAGVARVTLAP